jgi:sodium-dependent dicarboxylate transporter 2/3/5
MLTKLMFPNRLGVIKGASELIDKEYRELGPLGEPEIRVLAVFVLTALLWIFRSWIDSILPFMALNDTGIAMAATVALFIIPSRRRSAKKLLEWEDSKSLPWGILLLFGGGLSLAAALQEVGIIKMIGDGIAGLGIESTFGLMLAMSVVALFLTEVMSNVALTMVFVPVAAAMGVGMGASPLYFAVPVTIAASCAYMLPMATPPNAIVFASGHMKISDMARAGFVLNLIAALLISVMALVLMSEWKQV